MRRIIGIIVSTLLLWCGASWACNYYVTQWAGNVPYAGGGDVDYGMALEVTNAGGPSRQPVCANVYLLHDAKVVTCGACLISPDDGAHLWLPGIGALASYPTGVVKVVVSPPVDGACDPTNFHDADVLNATVVEKIQGHDGNGGQNLPLMPTDLQEWNSLQAQCASVHRFVQGQCQDP